MKQFLTNTLLTAFTILSISADSVTTKDGSVLNGTITLIDQGDINIETAYAGKLILKQSEVETLQTDTPVVIRLQSGTKMTGPVTASSGGKLKIESADGVLETAPAKLPLLGHRGPPILKSNVRAASGPTNWLPTSAEKAAILINFTSAQSSTSVSKVQTTSLALDSNTNKVMRMTIKQTTVRLAVSATKALTRRMWVGMCKAPSRQTKLATYTSAQQRVVASLIA